jgi:DNA-binding response OmpR family regulator
VAGTTPSAASARGEATQRRTVTSVAGQRANHDGAARVAPQVIIIDVVTDRAEILGDVVARRGGHATHVSTGAEAVKLIEAGQHHCVLVASLADGSPRAFVAWARRTYPTLTLLAAAEDVEQTTDLYVAGADHVVVVPLDADLLGAQLGASLRARGHLTLAA